MNTMKQTKTPSSSYDPYEFLTPLVWDIKNSNKHFANGPGISYTVAKDNDNFVLFIFNMTKGTTTREERFTSFEQAELFVNKTHYPHYMSPHIKQLEKWHET